MEFESSLDERTQESEPGADDPLTKLEYCNGKSATNSNADEIVFHEGEDKIKERGLIFPVDAYPPWYFSLLYAFQQVLTSISGPVTVAFLIHSTVCGGEDHVFLAELIGTCIFLSGICTIVQVTIGIRLPIIQVSTLEYMPLISSLMATPQWRCPASSNDQSNGTMLDDPANEFLWNDDNVSVSSSLEPPWKPRMRELSGAVAVAASVQVILGCTGMVGVLVKFIGPLTIAPAVALIGLSLQGFVAEYASQHWAVSISTACVFILVSQLLKNVPVPFPSYSKSRGFHFVYYPFFRLFPQIFAVIFGWILCVILTNTGQLTDQPASTGYKARTDTKTWLIGKSNWLFIPYPGMWGVPSFNAGVLLGMLSATICSMIESISDYYATARACGVAPPPKHAINRGIAIEGLSGVVCGMFGIAHASTSTSESIGLIPVTGMGSRVTWQVAGVLLILAGAFGKIGAILATIPDPVLGGLMIVSLGMAISVGLSNIQFVDLSISRNIMILGTSILLGLVVPGWIQENPDSINTGIDQVDQMIVILLGTSMFVGGLTGCLMDNLIPGTLEERGIIAFHRDAHEALNEYSSIAKECTSNSLDLYDLPLAKRLSCLAVRCCTYVPFLPCYRDRPLLVKKCRRRNVDPEKLEPNNGTK